MVLPSQVELDYIATPSAVLNVNDLSTKMGAVLLPTNDLLNLGLVLTSDVTSVGGGSAKRALTFGLIPPGRVLGPEINNGTSVGYIVSSSPLDKRPNPNGTWRVKFRCLKPDGSILDNEFAELNGTTPVPLLLHKGSVPAGTIQVVEPQGNAIHQGSIIVVMMSSDQGPHWFQSLLNGNWQGSVQSSNPADTNVQVQITYHDSAGGGPFTETVTLDANDATKPVNCVSVNHGTVDAFVVSLAPGGGNLGSITLFAGLGGQGPPMAIISPSYFAYIPFAIGQDFAAPLRKFFHQELSHALGMPVTASEPLFT